MATNNLALSALRHHVTGAVERGESAAVDCHETPAGSMRRRLPCVPFRDVPRGIIRVQRQYLAQGIDAYGCHALAGGTGARVLLCDARQVLRRAHAVMTPRRFWQRYLLTMLAIQACTAATLYLLGVFSK